MKQKILSSITALVCISFLNAQKSHLFFKGGLNISKFSSNNTSNFAEVNSIIGFNAGVLAKLSLGKKIALQPALLFSGKGAKTKGGNPPYNSTYFNASTSPYYIELPVNIVFDVSLKEKYSLFFGAGFYGALGIAGKNKIDGQTASGGSFNDEKKIGFAKEESVFPDYHNWAGIGYMAREDFGLTFTAGVHFKKLLFSLDYGLGLKNITRGDRTSADENKNRVLSISIGYQIL